MSKKRSHPMQPLHEASQDYGGIEADFISVLFQ